MAKVGRSESCPCGSGRKVKRCCGTEGALRLRARAAEAIEEAYALPVHFPRLRARGADLEAWAAAVAERGPDERTVREGLALLDASERSRIVRECREGDGTAWDDLVGEIGDEQDAETALVAGAVVAAVVERRPPPPLRIAALEKLPAPTDADALDRLVSPEDLWSILESARLDEELVRLDEELGEDAFEDAFHHAVADFARRHWSDWHEERLAELVGRARALLPFESFPVASAALAAACDAYERDPAAREELAALLLEDSLQRIDAARAAAEPFADAA